MIDDDLRRRIDASLKLLAVGCQTVETTVLEVTHLLVDAGVPPEGFQYFIDNAPKEIIKAASARLAKLRKDTDFIVELWSINKSGMTPRDIDNMKLTRQKLFQQVYEEFEILSRKSESMNDGA